jgi:hypothetical protein
MSFKNSNQTRQCRTQNSIAERKKRERKELIPSKFTAKRCMHENNKNTRQKHPKEN